MKIPSAITSQQTNYGIPHREFIIGPIATENEAGNQDQKDISNQSHMYRRRRRKAKSKAIINVESDENISTEQDTTETVLSEYRNAINETVLFETTF